MIYESHGINEEHPANAEVLQALSAQAVERTPQNSSQWDIDACELHTHPDLIERFELLAESLPKKHRRVARGGCPTLLTENGVVFAFASGMSQVTLRLSEGTTLPTTVIAFELKAPWYSFSPWEKKLERLTQELRRAWEEAERL